MAQTQIVNPVDSFRKTGISNPEMVAELIKQNFRIPSKPIANPPPNVVENANRVTINIQSLYNGGKISTYDIRKMNPAEMTLVTSVLKPERIISPIAAAPVIGKKPIERNFVYNITLRNPNERVAFTYQVGIDTPMPINRVFEYKPMKDAIARSNPNAISVTKGNAPVSIQEFRELLSGSKIESLVIVKQKTS